MGVAAFAASFPVSARIPSEGDARLEAWVTGFVSVGGTLVGSAVAIAAVLLTLDLQLRAEQRRRWASFQAGVLREAYEWMSATSTDFGQVLAAMQDWGFAVEAERGEKLEVARKRAQQFYDREQNLAEPERLSSLLENEHVKDALRDADAIIRQWNEQVAGDHTTRAVSLTMTNGMEWDVFQQLSAAYDKVKGAYAAAVRQAHE